MNDDKNTKKHLLLSAMENYDYISCYNNYNETNCKYCDKDDHKICDEICKQANINKNEFREICFELLNIGEIEGTASQHFQNFRKTQKGCLAVNSNKYLIQKNRKNKNENKNELLKIIVRECSKNPNNKIKISYISSLNNELNFDECLNLCEQLNNDNHIKIVQFESFDDTTDMENDAWIKLIDAKSFLFDGGYTKNELELKAIFNNSTINSNCVTNINNDTTFNGGICNKLENNTRSSKLEQKKKNLISKIIVWLVTFFKKTL